MEGLLFFHLSVHLLLGKSLDLITHQVSHNYHWVEVRPFCVLVQLDISKLLHLSWKPGNMIHECLFYQKIEMLWKILSDCVPISLADKEPLEVSVCFKDKAGTAIEGYLKHTDDGALESSDLEWLLLVDLIANIIGAVGHENDWINRLQLLLYDLCWLIMNWFKALEHWNNESPINFVGIKVLVVASQLVTKVWHGKVSFE